MTYPENETQRAVYAWTAPSGVRVWSETPQVPERLSDKFWLAHLPVSYGLWLRQMSKGVAQQRSALVRNCRAMRLR